MSATKNTPRYQRAFALIVALFFTWGFLNALNDVLVAAFRSIFHLDYRLATTVQVVFYLTCFGMSFLASRLLRTFSYKRTMILGLAGIALAGLCFAAASRLGIFPAFLLALAVMATGSVVLQTAAGPYVSLLGDAETASSRFSLALGVNSLGAMLAPMFGATWILPQARGINGSAALTTPYLAIAAAVAALALVVSLVQLPVVTGTTQETKQGRYRDLLHHPKLLFGAAAMFLYVGAEIAIGGLLINYLGLPTTLSATHERAGFLASLYGGGAMLGRFMGFPLLKKWRPTKVLAINACAAAICVLLSMLTHGWFAAATMLAVGICNSIMVPVLFTAAIEGLGPLTARGSGIMVAAVVGGAAIPFLQGTLADQIGLRWSFLAPLFCYLPIAAYAILCTQGRMDDRGLSSAAVALPTEPLP